MRGAAWAETAAISAAALLAALGVFGGFVALRGLNPLDVYAALVAGGFGSWFSLEETLTQAAPIMLTALCTALPARAGLLVIGGEGALVVGGVATVLAGVNLGGLPPPLALALMCLAGALGGGLWVGVAGALRHWRGVNETIATLLLNYIAIAVMNHLVAGPIRDFGQVLKPASWAIGERLMIGTIPATGIHWGLVFGVVACVVTWVLMRHTTTGSPAPRSSSATATPGSSSRSSRVRIRWRSSRSPSCWAGSPRAAGSCSGASVFPTRPRWSSRAFSSSRCSPPTRSTVAFDAHRETE